MAHQNKAGFGLEILCHRFPAVGIQVVGRFVDEQKTILPTEQRTQQQFGLFPAGKGEKGAVKHILPHPQQVQFPTKLPFRAAESQNGKQLFPRQAGVLHHWGKIPGGTGHHHLAGIRLIFHGQQGQQSGFTPSVASDQAGFPTGIQRHGKIFQHRLTAAGISETDMGQFYFRHRASL